MDEEPVAVSGFKSKSGWRRLLRAWGYSMAGLKAAWRGEHAFRQELYACVPAALVALLLPLAALEKLLLIGVLVLVLIIELINSAIEAAIDRVSLERHPLSKAAKDFGSAAVLLACLLALATWGVVLWPLLAGDA
jgi:diacylglycerol kinase (ATP)